MNKNERGRTFYAPPIVTVTHVILERSIAVQSPVREVNIKDWEYEYPEDEGNTADIWLNI